MGEEPHDRLRQKPEGGVTKFKKKPLYGTPKESWSWHTTALKQSAAWRSMEIHERRILDRLEIEHEWHAGSENGNLGVSSRQFVDHGVHKNMVGPAIDRLVKVGLLEITREGTGGRGAAHVARYRLTYLPAKTINKDAGVISYPDATNEWKHAPEVPKAYRTDRPRGSYSRKKIQKPTPHVGTNSTPHVGTNYALITPTWVPISHDFPPPTWVPSTRSTCLQAQATPPNPRPLTRTHGRRQPGSTAAGSAE
jgi:hypothetical protein